MLRTIPMTTWAGRGGAGTRSERQENKMRRSVHIDEGLWVLEEDWARRQDPVCAGGEGDL